MDRVRRFYSLDVMPEAPGGIHHRDCPCCLIRQRTEDACRSAWGMRGAGFGDRTIDRQLEREGYGAYVRELAIQLVNDALGPPANRHYFVT